MLFGDVVLSASLITVKHCCCFNSVLQHKFGFEIKR